MREAGVRVPEIHARFSHILAVRPVRATYPLSVSLPSSNPGHVTTSLGALSEMKSVKALTIVPATQQS